MASLLQQPPKKPKKTEPSTEAACQRLVSALSPIQQNFLLDESRFKVARAGRRAGKSYVDCALMAYTALQHAKAPVGYFGLTRDSAKEAVWETLKDLLTTCSIACTVNDAQLRVDFPNGSSIRLYGADMEQMKARFRGRKFKLVIIDECGFFAAVDELVTEALLPTLADMQGTICMTSSPGELPMGLFYEADQGDKKDHWSRYHWTLLDNPHFQQPSKNPLYANLGEEELDVICKMKFDGDRDNPAFRREYLGQWVFDRFSLVYPLQPQYRLPLSGRMHRPEYTIGINLSCYGRQGYVVVKYSQYQRNVEIVASGRAKCKNLNELAALLSSLKDTYVTDRLVCYLGKEPPEILDDFKQRYSQIPIQPSRYEKLPFFQTVIATDMDTGFINVREDNKHLLQEFDRIVRSDNGVEVAGQDTLLSDAFFACYLTLYNSHLKTIEPPETDDQIMERQLIERALNERYENDER